MYICTSVPVLTPLLVPTSQNVLLEVICLSVCPLWPLMAATNKPLTSSRRPLAGFFLVFETIHCKSCRWWCQSKKPSRSAAPCETLRPARLAPTTMSSARSQSLQPPFFPVPMLLVNFSISTVSTCLKALSCCIWTPYLINCPLGVCLLKAKYWENAARLFISFNFSMIGFAQTKGQPHTTADSLLPSSIRHLETHNDRTKKARYEEERSHLWPDLPASISLPQFKLIPSVNWFLKCINPAEMALFFLRLLMLYIPRWESEELAAPPCLLWDRQKQWVLSPENRQPYSLGYSWAQRDG